MPKACVHYHRFRRILLDHFENFNLQQIRQVRNITLEFQQFTTEYAQPILFVGRWNKHRNSWD